MTAQRKGFLLLAIQLALVCSVAGKYLYERWTCPRVWVRSMPYDPELMVRGRYLALTLNVNACDFDKRSAEHHVPHNVPQQLDIESWSWQHMRVVAKDGHLSAVPTDSWNENASNVELTARMPCDHALLIEPVDYFIPENAKVPLPLKSGKELWVEVTVPPAGEPRPIQLGIGSNGKFTPLNLR
jgi:uncharacterized membrane-anchored protein